MTDKLQRDQARYLSLEIKIKSELDRLSRFRLLSFFGIVLAFLLSVSSLYFSTLVLPFTVVFILFVKKSNVLKAKESLLESKLEIIQKNLNRLSSNWKEKLKLDKASSNSALLKDIAVYGFGSFWHFLYENGSSFAKAKLQENFETINSLSLDDVLKNQKINRKLKGKNLRRIQLLSLIKEINWQEDSIDSFKTWLKKPQEELKSFLLFRLLAIVFTLNFLLAIYLNTAVYLFSQFLIHLVLVQIFHKSWTDIYLEGLSKEKRFSSFAAIFSFIEQRYSNERNLLKTKLNSIDLKSTFLDFQFLNERLSLVYSGMGYAMINACVFWDAWYIPKLIKWKEKHRDIYDEFFALLAELESFENLANFAFLKKSYNYPNIDDSFAIKARNLAHPLIDEKVVVANSLSLDHSEMMLITGSNMSGKTTFIRTVALNIMLAYQGLPVFSDKFELGLFKLVSSITISDSLADGVSFFYAEVKQIKEVLNKAESEKNVIYFLDEMLKGTNVRERTIACENVIEQLLNTEAIGLFSTHDLALTKLEENYPKQIKNVHFSERDNADKLDFDFKLKQGVVQSSNALAILEREGLYKK